MHCYAVFAVAIALISDSTPESGSSFACKDCLFLLLQLTLENPSQGILLFSGTSNLYDVNEASLELTAS